MGKLFLACDTPLIETAVQSLLEGTAHRIIGTANPAGAALESTRFNRAELLIVECETPTTASLRFLRELRDCSSPVRVVLLVQKLEDIYLREAMALDVAGIFLKSSPTLHLLECINTVAIGQHWMDPKLQARARSLVFSSRAPRGGLTARDRNLVRLVRLGLRNREIGEHLGVTEGSVKVYLHELFKKLDVNSRTELALKALDFTPPQETGPTQAARNPTIRKASKRGG